MSVKKYILGMRPKKYLTRDFVVYRDPSSQPQEASIEQREGFKDGTKIQKEFLFNFIKENQGISNKAKAEKLNELGYVHSRGGPITEGVIEKFISTNPELKGQGKITFASIEDLKEEATPKQLNDFESGLIDEKTFRNRVVVGRGDKKKTPEYKREAAKRKYERVMADPERKATMKATQARSAEKRYLEKGMFPPSKSPKDALWRDLLRSADYGERITWITDRPKKFPRSVFENIELMDNKTGERITYTNLSTHPEYENAIKAYEAKDVVKQTKLPENIRKRLTFQRGEGGMKDTIVIQHNEGLAKNPFNTSLAIQQENRAEASLRVKFARDFDNATTLSEKKQAVKNFATGLSEQAPNIASQPGKKTYGQAKDLPNLVSAALNDIDKQELTTIISTLAPGCRVNYSDGGRVNYSTGSDCFNRGVEVLKQATQGDKTGLQKVKANLKQFGKAGGKVLRWLELPVEIIAEGLFVGYDMAFNGKPYSEAVKDSGLVLRLATSDFKTSGEEDRANAIAEANPEAAKYIEAKRALDKYNSLKNDVMTFKDDLASADSYEAAAKKFNDYEKKIEDKLPQYRAILTPGSPEYEAFKTDRTGLAKERNDKVYDQAISMGQMDPIEGAVDEQEILKARDERFEGQINEIGSIYDWKPTLDEYKKNVIPNIYKATNKVLGENAEFDAFIEDFVGKQYNKDLDLFTRPGFAGGGLTRRGFLKFIGGLTAAAAAIKSGIVKLTTPAAKQVLKNAPTGTPDWFAPLVERILKEGVEVPNANVKTVTGREKVTKLEMPSEGAEGTLTDKYYLFENPDTGEIRVDIDVPGVGANDNEFSIFMRPDRVEGINDDGTPQLSEGEFFLSEDRAAGIQSGPDDWDMELLSTDVSLEDSASDWHAVEKFATGKTNKAAQVEKQKFKNAVEADPTQDIVNRYGEYDYPGPDVDDYE